MNKQHMLFLPSLIRLFAYSSIGLFVYSLIPLLDYSTVYAQSLTLPDGTTIQGKLDPATFNGSLTIGNILSRATPFLFAAAGIGLLIMLIMGGFAFLTSAGDSKKMEEGKQRITNALIGFLIIFSAFWIVQIVGTMTGFSAIGNLFK